MTRDIRDALAYCPETGVFTWREGNKGQRKAGSVAGTTTKDGYRRIGFGGVSYSCNRLAFFFMKGYWPVTTLDHKNRVRDDDRWVNLRECTQSQNVANTRTRNVIGRGVTLHRKTGKYQAQIKCGGRNHYLGLFEHPDEAKSAYAVAAVEFFGEFAVLA